MMLADYHMHSAFSPDSALPLEELIETAIRKGLDEICITDHCDYSVKGAGHGLWELDFPRYYEHYLALKKRYQDQITIRFGCEFGVQEACIKRYQEVYAAYPFDFIILSNHQIDDLEFWDQGFQKGKTQAEYNRQYYEAILAVMKRFDDYQVLGHLDMIKRYDEQGVYPDETCMDVIDAILKLAIEKGKGIELNTSYHRYGLADSTPSHMILKRYRELGGVIVTIGSDSHDAAQVGAYIEEGKQVLRACGFSSFCTFEKGKPLFHAL